MLYPVIMAGGSGTRLWPKSRQQYPKQFLRLIGDQSMLQQTVLRLDGLNVADPLLICNEEHRFLAAEQMREIGELAHNIILEPVGRNTAPAIALAALAALEKDENAVLLVLAADHLIKDVSAFQASVRQAEPFAEAGSLCTFGIVPQSPEICYGYIKRGENKNGAFAVSEFREKPDRATAERYVASGDYYWNSGMFLFGARQYLDELKEWRPDIYTACMEAMANTQADLDFIRVKAEAFAECPSESVDYAVMEKTKNARVVPMDAGWSDVGSWSSLWDVAEQDDNHNVTQGDVLSHSTTNSLIYAENSLVATVGIDNLVIIQTKDAVLVAAQDKVQDVKAIVAQIQSADRHEYRVHREVFRPWGKYDAIDQAPRYQVKRITVKPGEKLSVQMHHHRSEHWVVVSGTAKVTIDDETRLVTENESVYIPVGSMHSLENPGKIPIELIEIQSGSYLDEDDIVRFEDRYGRC